MIPDAILHQIQDRIDIVEIVSAHVPLKRAGRNFKANCPFHNERTPSFMVNPEKQIFHCFGCGAGGNVFGFLMKLEKRDFPDVVEMLAERVGIEIPKDRPANPEAAERASALLKAQELAATLYHQWLLGARDAEPARRYLEARGVDARTIAAFKLGFAPEAWDRLYQAAKAHVPEKVLERAGLILPKRDGAGFYDRFRHRVIFPILDAKGQCVAFGGRVLDDALPKYLNSPETEVYQKGRHLYGLFQGRKAIRDLDQALVVEGYMDVIACHQAGVEHAVASLGTALTPDQVRLLKRQTANVVMLYDADAAGESATQRGLELFLEEGVEVRVVRLPEGHDPDSFIRTQGVESFREALAAAKSLFEFKLDRLKEQYSPASLEGRVKIANEMAALLAKVRNEILRAAWEKELAERLRLPEAALRAEIRKEEDRNRPMAPEAPSARTAEGECRPAEKLLLGLLMDDPEWVRRARDEVRLDDFQHARARELARLIFAHPSGGEPPKRLLSVYGQDPETARIITMACAETESLQDKDKAFVDCVSWFKHQRLERERDGLKAEIEAAERSGDKNRIRQLLADFNELNKGMKKIHEKK